MSSHPSGWISCSVDSLAACDCGRVEDPDVPVLDPVPLFQQEATDDFLMDMDEGPCQVPCSRAYGGPSFNKTCTANDETLLPSLYNITDAKLGRGSYGEVTVGINKRSLARRAIKTICKSKSRAHDVASVLREVDMLRSLDHPNVICFHDFFQDDNFMHIVIELCEGGSLLGFINDEVPRMPESDVAFYAAQIVGAIQYVHSRGIVHRDLKPENFLFTRDEPERQPFPPKVGSLKLIDFGFSRPAPCVRDGLIVSAAAPKLTPRTGTFGYMAPEVETGEATEALADRADVWSIGIIIHIMLTGCFPHPLLLENPREFFKDEFWDTSNFGCSSDARDLLCLMLHLEPDRRTKAAAALKHVWLNSGVSGTDNSEFATHIPDAIRSFASISELQKMLRVANAREADSEDVQKIAGLYQRIEFDCGGPLTRAALQHAVKRQQTAGAIAQALVDTFDAVNNSGSGAITWSEFVAAALCQEDTHVDASTRLEGAFMKAIDEAMNSSRWSSGYPRNTSKMSSGHYRNGTNTKLRDDLSFLEVLDAQRRGRALHATAAPGHFLPETTCEFEL